jgi:ferredoxin
MTATADALRQAGEHGVVFTLEAGRVRCHNGEALPDDLFKTLFEQLPELREILAGERCRYCGECLDRSQPGIIPFADGRAAHLTCHGAVELPWAEQRPANDDAKAALAVPPDPATAPIGKCRSCGGMTPLTVRGTCWQCSPTAPPATAPTAAPPPWDGDRAWIARWCRPGPTLADREPVLRAWLTAAPPQPLPRCLAAVELARIARQHGITAEVAARDAPPACRTETTTLSGKDLPHD